MSRITDTDRRQTYLASPSQEKYPTHEPFDFMYPYNHRYIQGEPNYQMPWQPGPLRPSQAPVTSISPHEMHRNPYPSTTECVRPSQMARHRSRSRGDPEYVKRPRRRAEEVERLYICNWEGCDKAYGALNHLNTHVRNAEHGPKREPRGTNVVNLADFQNLLPCDVNRRRDWPGREKLKAIHFIVIREMGCIIWELILSQRLSRPILHIRPP